LHPQVLAWVQEWRAGRRTGRVEIEILLADTAAPALARIHALGFQSTKATAEARRLVGRIGVDKLEALARLESVLFLAPSGAK
jgi:hypothetical protein